MPSIMVEILGSAKQFQGEIDKAVASTERANSGFSKMGKAAGVVGVALGGALVVGLGKAAEASMNFQQQMELVRTQAGGTQKDVKTLSAGILAMAGSTTQGPMKLAEAMFHLKSEGLGNVEALKALKVSSSAATMGIADLTDTTNALGGAVASGIRGAGNFKGAMATLNAGIGQGNMTMQDLVQAFHTTLPATARSAGVSLRSIVAAVADLTRQGVPAGSAATRLATAIFKLISPSKQGAAAMASVGLTGAEVGRKMAGPGGIVSAIQLLKEHFDRIHDPQARFAAESDAFGKSKTAGVVMQLVNSVGQLGSIYQKVNPDVAKFNASAKAAADEPKAKLEMLKSTFQALEIEIGMMVLPAIVTLTGAFKRLGDFFQQHQSLAKALVVGLGILSAALIAVSVATWAVNTAMLANPITLVVVALAALVVGVIYAYTHFRTFRDVVNTAFNDVKAVIRDVVSASNALWATFGSTITRVFNSVKQVVGDAMRTVADVINTVGDVIHGRWGKVWGDLRTLVSDAFSLVFAYLSGVPSIIGGLLLRAGVAGTHALIGELQKLPGQVAQVLGSMASIAFNLARGLGSAIVSGIISGLGNLASSVGSAIGSGLSAAVGIGKGIIGAHSPSRLTHQELGVPMAEGVLEGWLIGTASLPSKMAQTLQNAITAGRAVIQAGITSLQSAWQQLTSDADTAFTKIKGAVQTPAEQEVAAMQAKKAADDRQQALNAANAQLTTAQATGDPVQIAAAQQQVNDALYNIQLAGAQQRAAAQRVQLDAQNALQQRHFDAALVALEQHLAKGHTSYKKAHEEILKLFKSFGVNYRDAGTILGIAFITGLKESIKAAASKSGSLAKQLTSVADGIHVPHAQTGGFVSQTGMAVIHAGETIIPAGGGGGTIHVTVNGFVGNDQDIAEKLRNVLIRTGRNQSGGVLGGLA